MRNSSLGISKEKYLEICKVTNSQVDPDKIPIEYNDFLTDTKLAMEIVNILPDKWDSMAGASMGKDLSMLPFLLDMYNVSNQPDMLDLILTIISEGTNITNENMRKKVSNVK